MNGQYIIYRRDRATGIRDTIVERFTSFSITLHWGELSKFSMKGKTIGEVEVQPGDGIVFYRNREYFFSGIVSTVTIKCSDVASGLKEWSAEGYEDSVIFSNWLAFADPESITFNDGIVDKCEDYAWNRLLYYIRRNMGADALTDREISGLTLPDAANKGQNTESAYRYQELDKVLEEIGKEVDGDDVPNELFPRFVWDPDTGAKSVIIPEQRDMTESIVVAPEFGNIINWTKKETLPSCNAVWVCSGTADDTRLYVYQKDDDSIDKYGRIEKVVTKSDIQVTDDVTQSEVYTLLNAEAKKTLTEGAYKEKFSGTMVETPELQFMSHWRCGDLVSCMIDGHKFQTTIKTVEIAFADGFEQVKPTLGETEHGIFADVFRTLKGLDDRMNKEELS